MLDLNVYRVAFAPLAVALVILAFSLDGAPEPIDPGPVTTTFDAPAAAAAARTLAREFPDRAPGSDGDLAAADFVEERFGQIAAGRVLEQNFTAEIDGSDRELRNVVLLLPGASDEAVLVLAGRDARVGPGVASSAAATGVLLELANWLGTTERERTLILASTDGASEGAAGAHELLKALPERFELEAAVVISQPGSAALEPPHLLAGSTGAERPPARLIATARSMLERQAELDPGLDGAVGQLVGLALPAALGEQAALTARGLGAVTISSAGQLPLAPEEDTREQLAVESLDRLGRAALATVGALTTASGPAAEPGAYVRAGDNIVPGWALGLIALALLAPPAALAVTGLARSARDGTAQTAIGWVLAWVTPGLVALVALYALALVGLIPTPQFPFDPATLSLGFDEGIALLFLCGVAIAVAIVGPGLHLPAGPSRATLAAAAAAVAVAAALVVWLVNPFLALLLVPITHVVAVHGRREPLGQLAVAAVALAAAIPFGAALLHVASELGWGAEAPWQVAVLTATGQIGAPEAAATLVLLGATLASVLAAGRRGDGGLSTRGHDRRVTAPSRD